jgi:hypothetical protein
MTVGDERPNARELLARGALNDPPRMCKPLPARNALPP